MFVYEYFGTGDKVEYSITYTYKVIDGMLHISHSNNEKFVFAPSEINYKESFSNTAEIIQMEGCMNIIFRYFINSLFSPKWPLPPILLTS